MSDERKIPTETKLPLWGVLTVFFSLVITSGSLLYANSTKASEKELDSFKMNVKEIEVKFQGLDKRTAVVETKIDSILEGVKNLNAKIDKGNEK